MLTVAFAALFISPVQAQQRCGDRAAIEKRLKDKYQERRVSFGIAVNGALTEIFAAESGSWTIAVTMPGRPTCVVAIGEHWQQEKKPRGDGI